MGFRLRYFQYLAMLGVTVVRFRPKILSLFSIQILFFVGCSRNEIQEFRLTSKEGLETIARLETTQGDIVIRFDPDRAPAHVVNFVNLCGMGFYDGTYFHRVAPGFLIQGGDPYTKDEDRSNDGLGGHTYAGPETTLRMELREDPTYNRGDVVMARTDEVDSAGSQFFVMLSSGDASLGDFTVFGEVAEGIEVADRISEQPGEPLPQLGGMNPAKRQYIEKCILEERPKEPEKGSGQRSQEPSFPK